MVFDFFLNYVLLIFNHTEFLVRFITVLVVCLSSFIIFLKSKSMYKLTNHKGINIFSYAFLYIFIGYFLNFIMFLVKEFISFNIQKEYLLYIYLGDFLAFYTLTTSILLLVYSLTYKELSDKIIIFKKEFLVNKIIVLNFLGLIIGFISSVYSRNIMFIVIIISLLYASYLTYVNYLLNKDNKNKFSQLYFIVLILTLFIAIGHFVIIFVELLKFYIYIMTIIIFLIILYGFKYSKKIK